MTMKRRDALKTIGGLAGAAGVAKFLPGCGGGGGEDGPVGITTFVYLMMENRTYDHALGARALEGLGGDGLRADMANLDINGVSVPVFEAADDRGSATPSLCDPDPPHGRTASIAQFNTGTNDGFLREHQTEHGASAKEPMKFLTRKHLPISWALADEYTSCDRWFCSVMGPTLPNRAYWHTGTSFGLDNNDAILDKFSAGVPVASIYNRLEEAGVDWAYYAGNIAVAALLAQPGPFQIDVGPNDGTGHVRRFGDAKQLGGGDFFDDCEAGRLPAVVYIDPAFGVNDDHPPAHPILGQELISAVYTALSKSPQWKNILLVITYDEHGGYFDHVPPPTTVDNTLQDYGVAGFEQMGFRVPTLVIGPYVKGGVTSTVYDHTSALKHLQTHFGLAPLNARVDAAADLTDCIDQERLAAGDPADPIELPVIDSSDWPFDADGCMGTGFKPSDDPISSYADRHPGAFGSWDLRSETADYLQGIRNYLRRNGLYK